MSFLPIEKRKGVEAVRVAGPSLEPVLGSLDARLRRERTAPAPTGHQRQQFDVGTFVIKTAVALAGEDWGHLSVILPTLFNGQQPPHHQRAKESTHAGSFTTNMPYSWPCKTSCCSTVSSTTTSYYTSTAVKQ